MAFTNGVTMILVKGYDDIRVPIGGWLSSEKSLPISSHPESHVGSAASYSTIYNVSHFIFTNGIFGKRGGSNFLFLFI